MTEAVAGRGMGPGALRVFPHDRVVFFSDAVFAIAMTLLAIEIRIPDHAAIERLGAGAAWGALIPLFVAYFISFLVLGIYWVGHMQAWDQVTRATPRLVWLNILQLMCVALVPFGTSLYAEAFLFGPSAALAAYCAILAAIALFSCLLRVAILRQEPLRERLGTADTRWFLLRALIPLAVFTLGIAAAYVIPNWAGGWWFMLIWPLSVIARRIVYRDAARSAS